jgi:small subunit ribosomal protein S17e
VVPSKRLRNKILGFMTHLMKRIQRGSSSKLQKEERARKANYVPEVSALDTSATGLEVDPDTKVRRALCFSGSLNTDNLRRRSLNPSTSTPSRSTSSPRAVPERGQCRERRPVPGAGRS